MSHPPLVACESVAAVVLHAREVTAVTPVTLGGHALPRPVTLCGTEAAWDTKSPITSVHCRSCIAELAKRGIAVLPKGRRP